MTGSREQRPGRRAGLALALALVLHAAATLWLLRPRQVRPEPERIELTLLPKRHVEPSPPAPVALVEPPKPERAVVRKRKAKTGPATAAQEAAPLRAAPEPPEQLKSPEGPPPSPSLPPSTDPKDVRLFDPGALAKGLGRPGPPSHGLKPDGPSGDGNSPAEERARVTGRIQGEIAEQQATERVEAGLVDPYFRQLARATNGEWKLTPPASDAEELRQIRDTRELLTRWFGVGRTYAKTGNPHAGYDTQPGPDKFVHPTGRDATPEDLAAFNVHWDTGRGFFVGGLLVVELTQDSQGEPLHIRLLRSSGSEELDTSAQKAVTLAAKQRLAPAHGLGLGGERILSLWKMEARVVPPGCSFIPDPAGQTAQNRFAPSLVECGNTFDLSADGVVLEAPIVNTPFGAFSTTPLRRKVITHVELVAVYGGETGPVSPDVKVK